ncbi:MAG: aldo/keto reductase [Candidatus Omnitrophota bacterium]|nr:aldo/keto reductase [Candidatus Omnitrophota bacterium]
MFKKRAIEEDITALTLGTTQLGSHYGIANRTGCPGEKEAYRILEVSFDNGIHSFDTASAYGKSEDILGRFIGSNKCKPFIISKLPGVGKLKYAGRDLIYENIRKSVLGSLKRLKKDKINAYLLHDASDIGSNGKKIIEALSRIKKDGLIGMIGASCYYAHEVEAALSMDEIGAIQVPINLFDHRFIEPRLLARIKKSGKILFARSVFLQGLFFLDPDRMPRGMEFYAKYLKRLREFLRGEGVGIHDLALGFLKSIPEISSVIIGAESSDQILEDINIFRKARIGKDVKKRLFRYFSDIPLRLKIPSLWFSKTKKGGYEKE